MGSMRLEIESTEPEAVRDEVDCIVENYEETPKSPEGTLRQEPFEIDVTSLVRNLGRNITKLIAKGIVQDHYNGDWNKVRFIGLESSPLIPLQRGNV